MKQIIFTIAIHPFPLKIDQTPAIRACLTTLMAGIDFGINIRQLLPKSFHVFDYIFWLSGHVTLQVADS